MKGMKYIMYKNWQEIEIPVLFPPCLEHDAVARVLTNGKSLISAGFVSLGNDGKVSVAGHSHSLNLKSREEDAKIIEDWLGWEL